MRVCHLCDGSVAGDYFRNITSGLTRNGVDVLLVELGPGTEPTWLKDFPGVRYVSLNAAGKMQYLSAAKRLGELLRSEKTDILHTHLFYSGLIGVYAKRFTPATKVAIMRHHTDVVRMQGTRFHVAADRWMAQKADHLMTVSEAARRYMLDVDGIRRDDIELVYLGFDFEKLKPDTALRQKTRQEFGFDDDDIVIGYVANFAAGKGHVQLISAFDLVKRQIPNAKLILAGRGKLKAVEDTVGRLGLGRRIVFAGWQDDVSLVYNAMDIFVQPSLSEAFSQVLIEAMGCRLPVIATKVGGAAEVIENDVNGILIEPDDPQAIAREVIRLAEDKKLRSAIAERGMNSVRERFSAETMVERHLELYERWIDES